MMRFTLHCDNAHEFEAWFGGNTDFEEQRERGLVECPQCGSPHVEKSLMAPRVSTGRRKDARMEGMRQTLTNVHDGMMREKVREIAKTIRENTTDVGARFPEEARRIHYGEAEERGIRGQASPDEAKALVEEGVTIAPVPSVPDEAN